MKLLTLLSIISFFSVLHVFAQTNKTELVKATKKPVAGMYSLPFQSNKAYVIDQEGTGEKADSEINNLEEINRKLENPMTNLWSLIVQENFSLNKGELVNGTIKSNTFFFQPALPVPVSDDLIFIGRPVFPVVTRPVFSVDGSVEEYKTGFGDIQAFTAVGPNRTDGKVWGAGATFIFPTASDDLFGQGKWQAGPALLYFYLGRPWTLGVFAQHWWSFAGDDNRDDLCRTDIQYVCRRQIPGAWSIGMGPTITINWKADEGNRVTLPIGLGVTKTIRIGSTPIKMRIEPQYSIIRPDDYGTEWNIRIQIAPVIRSPFK